MVERHDLLRDGHAGETRRLLDSHRDREHVGSRGDVEDVRPRGHTIWRGRVEYHGCADRMLVSAWAIRKDAARGDPMSDVDVGRLERLRASMEGSLNTEAGPTSTAALRAADERAYNAVVAILPEDLRSEFTSLFEPDRGWGTSDDLIAASAGAHQARERLHAMAGWLDGLIATEQRRR